MLNLNRISLAALALITLALLSTTSARASGGIAVTTCGKDLTIAYSPTVLFPPNHKLKTISIVATDTDSDGPEEPASITVTSITGNQENAPGEGCGERGEEHGPDWTGIGNSVSGNVDPGSLNLSVQLRAERCVRLGDRLYTIEISCDDNGGTGTAELTVTVPRNRGR
jgi:hypothetical protein